MKVIIPMAGLGKRMRPHTLTTPKPLINLAGKSIVEHLVEEIAEVCKEKVEEIAFITGCFGEQAETQLKETAERLGAKASIYYQDQALGTAHAVLCAAPSLHGKVIVAFADTLFFAKFDFDTEKEAVIWTHKVEDPSAFGVVLSSSEGKISGFAEKPKTFVSNQAIIGIYYFKDGENLRKELQYLLDHKIEKSGEYQLTDALQNMLDKSMPFYTAQVDHWLDCGNKQATVETHRKLLQLKSRAAFTASDLQQMNSVIIPPCHIMEGVVLENSVIGPYVSIGKNTRIKNSRILNSVVQETVRIEGICLMDSMIGSHVDLEKDFTELNMGDYSQATL